jgi:hypothetical protein
MTERTEVPLHTLPAGSYFELPWRKEGSRFGYLKSIGDSGCSVRLPKPDGPGYDDYSITRQTMVLPASEKEFHTQRMEKEGATPRAKSDIESPVAVVHRICDELEGHHRDEIIQACIDQGVNPNTAKTQYYVWRKKNK